MSSTRFLIVRNPAAGHARQQHIESIVSALNAQGAACVDLYETSGPGDAVSAVAARASHYDVVVAAGGDGTVNEVLNGLREHSQTTLGIIPCGTTNVLATELGLPSSTPKIAAVLGAGHTRTIYPGTANERRFGMMVGIGYDAWVVDGVEPALKKKIGKLAYVLSMFRELRHFGSRRYQLQLDGENYEACSAVLTLGRHYAGSYILAREACLEEAEMDVVLVQTARPMAFLLMLLVLPLGLASRLPFMKTVKARQALIRMISPAAGAPEKLQADGDIAGTLPTTITVATTPMRVLAPR